MEPLLKSELFFVISSVGFVVLFILLGFALYYAIRSLKKFDRILTNAEADAKEIGKEAKGMVHDMHESVIFRLLTAKKVRRNKKL